MSKQSFNGNTTCGSTYTPPETAPEMMMSLWSGQIALNGYNNFNLMLDKAEGLFYTTTETFDELVPYLQKYYKQGYLNTGGRDINKYIQRVLKNYAVKEYPNRPAYLLYVNATSKFNRGENKIVGITAEGLEMAKEASRIFKADKKIQEEVAKTNPLKAFAMMLDTLKDDLVKEREKEEKEEGSTILTEKEFDEKYPNTDMDFLLKDLKMPTASDLKEEKPKVANIWVMKPNSPSIQQVKYDFKLSTKFPNGFECRQFCITDIMDYYVVFFDADDSGAYNQSAKWIASHCGVAPTGYFVVMRKKWIDGEEHTVEMDITPKEFKQRYLK